MSENNKTTLSQALKVKSRLAGELTRLQQIFQRENSKRNDSTSNVDRRLLWEQIKETSTKLAELKGKITVANIGIYPVLELMSELKSTIAFLNGISKREGPEIEPAYGNNERITYTWSSYINQESADKLIFEYQELLNESQDKVDQYNHSHYID